MKNDCHSSPVQPGHLSHPRYRADIDGLRAIAIFSVVGFHASPFWVKGGFVGVDIFFVISGFLISTIIFNNLENNTFSFIEFYSRRIKRIFPALLTVLIACFVLGWLTLFADEYKQLGKHIAGGAGFASNLVLWSESGYFDNASETKPLLHLWSLGIEEQFYIVWPLLVWIAWKAQFNLLAMTIVVAAVSFVLNVRGIRTDAIATFYSPQTRFWELLAGSVLAFALHKKGYKAVLSPQSLAHINDLFNWTSISKNTLRNAQALGGAVLIATAFLLTTKESRFPGWWAVMPTIGTILIIAAGAQAWLNRIVLSNRLLVWFGLISYPLYLWHWPLLSFARIVEGEIPTRNIRIIAVLVSIVLAWLTYKFIEKPVRFGGFKNINAFILALPMVLVGFVGYITYDGDGWRFRAIEKDLQHYISSIARDGNKACIDMPLAYKKDSDWFCILGDTNEATAQIFVFGDSHAYSLLPVFERISRENNIKILFVSNSGCLPLLGVEVNRGADWLEKYNCPKLNERVFEYVKENMIKNVFLISYWTYYGHSNVGPAKDNTYRLGKIETANSSVERGAWYDYGIKNTINRYNEIGANLFFFEDNPTQAFHPKDVLRKARRHLNDDGINKFSVLEDIHKNRQFDISNEFSKIDKKLATVVNFNDLLCQNNICPLVADGKFIYYDSHHLSTSGSMLVYPKIERLLPLLK